MTRRKRDRNGAKPPTKLQIAEATQQALAKMNAEVRVLQLNMYQCFVQRVLTEVDTMTFDELFKLPPKERVEYLMISFGYKVEMHELTDVFMPGYSGESIHFFVLTRDQEFFVSLLRLLVPEKNVVMNDVGVECRVELFDQETQVERLPKQDMYQIMLGVLEGLE